MSITQYIISIVKKTLESFRASQKPMDIQSDVPAPEIQPTPVPAVKTKAELLYSTAASLLGHHLASSNPVLGCALTVNEIARRAWGHEIGGGASTYAMWQALRDEKKYARVLPSEAKPGDIIISPTGSVPNARLKNGHVGIVAKHGILSNNSETGTLQEVYDLLSWQSYYTTYGRLPTLFFHPIG